MLYSGSVLALAGGFQFTSLKEASLRSAATRGVPAALLRARNRRRVQARCRHGILCVGCCWALMLVMFAVGAANLVWMAVPAALMVHEKTRPLAAPGLPVTGIALLGVASVTLIYSACGSGQVPNRAPLHPGRTTGPGTGGSAGACLAPHLCHSALEAGADVVELQTLLGHASLDTTRRYLDATTKGSARWSGPPASPFPGRRGHRQTSVPPARGMSTAASSGMRPLLSRWCCPPAQVAGAGKARRGEMARAPRWPG